MQKGQTLVYILVGILVIGLVAGGAYYLGKSWFLEQQISKLKACKQDTKVCSDGSTVGRTSPSCEFAKCLDEILQEKTATWNKYENQKFGLSFKYPQNYLVEESKYENENLYQLRINSKPTPAPSAQYLVVLVNILINKSNSQDTSEEVGSYKFASTVYNSFANYVGEQDILIGRIVDTTRGFATKVGEQKIGDVRAIKYRLQGSDVKDHEGFAIRTEEKTLNIYILDNSLDPNFASYDQSQWENIDAIIKTIKFYSK